MRNILIRSVLLCLLPMAACGEEEGGNAAEVYEQRTRFYQLVCTCALPPAQQGMVVSEGAACVSDYVGGSERRSCIVNRVNASWGELRAEAECVQEVYEAAENCVTRPPGCPEVGNCLALVSNVDECGTAIAAATSDC
jgi:hypothetical protein